MFSLGKDYQTVTVPPRTSLDMMLKKGVLLIVLKIQLYFSQNIYCRESLSEEVESGCSPLGFDAYADIYFRRYILQIFSLLKE